jgi:hypothetical protein
MTITSLGRLSTNCQLLRPTVSWHIIAVNAHIDPATARVVRYLTLLNAKLRERGGSASPCRVGLKTKLDQFHQISQRPRSSVMDRARDS